MKNMDRVIFGSVLLIGLGFGLNAKACTTDGWLGGASNVTVGSPTDLSRYSELCAMAVDATGYVQSDEASHTKYIGRFYVYPDVDGAGTTDLLVAYSDEGGASELFKISYDGSDFIFDAGGATGSSGSTIANSGWNLVEFEYDSDSGNFNFWVNAPWDFTNLSYAAPTGSFASGTGTVESVRLGAPNGMGGNSGTIYYDAFESHASTNVGALLTGDANKDGFVDTGDIGTVINEFFSVSAVLATGTPDCNKDGEVNTGDIGCIITIFFTP